jgi:ESF2/ABP1 family protein
MLNGKQIGGKKRSAYFYDLWNLKYLPKFKWDHLTEEIAYEKAVREQKLAQELSAARKEREFYLSRVDKAKAVKAMSERRAGKAAAASGDREGLEGEGKGSAAAADAAGDPSAGQMGRGAEALRHYGQRRAKPDPAAAGLGHALPADLLDMVAAKKRKVA